MQQSHKWIWRIYYHETILQTSGLSFLCSQNIDVNPKCFQNLSKICYNFDFSFSKVQFLDFVCAATLVVWNFEKLFWKFAFFYKAKEISFLLFHNHGWGSVPHFMMIEKVRLNLKYLNVKTRQSEMMLPKSYSTFSHQQLQLFLKVANSKIWIYGCKESLILTKKCIYHFCSLCFFKILKYNF